MKKQELRKIYKQKRSELTPSIIEEKSISIANKSLALPIWEKENFHLFLSIEHQNEVDTNYLLHILQGRDKNVVISKSDFSDTSMKHFLLTDATKLVVNQWGIPEPENGFEVSPKKIDVVFLPLLAFDLKGNRVGYGKGFYDRFLSECKNKVMKIGLSFFEAEEVVEDAHYSDVPLDYCITTQEIYTFNQEN
ncbi:MAG: 5-formyltetrahydrofolate cyclo-ligase [Psychroflexus maritimus]